MGLSIKRFDDMADLANWVTNTTGYVFDRPILAFLGQRWYGPTRKIQGSNHSKSESVLRRTLEQLAMHTLGATQELGAKPVNWDWRDMEIGGTNCCD